MTDEIPTIVNEIENDQEERDEFVKTEKVKLTQEEQYAQMKQKRREKEFAGKLHTIEIDLPTELAVREMERFLKEKIEVPYARIDELVLETTVTEDEVDRIESKLSWMERSMGVSRGVLSVTRTLSDGITTAAKAALPVVKVTSVALASTARALGTTTVKSASIGLQETARGYRSFREDLATDETVQDAKQTLRNGKDSVLSMFGVKKRGKSSAYSGIRRKGGDGSDA